MFEKLKDNLKYISNFSGSFGFALILKNKNYLSKKSNTLSDVLYVSAKNKSKKRKLRLTHFGLVHDSDKENIKRQLRLK